MQWLFLTLTLALTILFTPPLPPLQTEMRQVYLAANNAPCDNDDNGDNDDNDDNDDKFANLPSNLLSV